MPSSNTSASCDQSVVNGDPPVISGDHVSSNSPHPANWVPVLESPVYTPRKLRVVCVGAGLSGLTLVYVLKDKNMEEYVDLCIYEKNHGVGGTWLENRYPGVACDIPAHQYTFSFEPNPNYSSYYAKGPEILEYFRKTTAKYNLDKDVKFNSKIIDASWDSGIKKWKISIEQKGVIVEDVADILINASGVLNKYQWPEIDGLQNFKGELLHSANWDTSLEWKSKKVAVIGNGSSGIQIVPQIQPTAAKLVNYIRAATWIMPSWALEFAPTTPGQVYTEDQKREFREDPESLLKLRHDIEHFCNQFFQMLIRDSPLQKQLGPAFKQMMCERLNHNEELIKQLVPEWELGCRRLTPGPGYLEALQSSNCSFSTSPIVRITEKGIETDEGVEEFDIIICATGFDASCKPYFNVTGRDGISLSKVMENNPQAYFGICNANVPNYFSFTSANSPVGQGSFFAGMEWAASYILQWVKKIATEDISSVVVKERAINDYNVYSQEFLKRMVWSGNCRSWYKNGKVGENVVALYAGSILHYKEILEHVRGEDFDIEYNSKNSFRFMGNGLTLREERGEDLAFYLLK